MTLRIEVFKGPETKPYVQALAEMRIEAFREFPYLYIGNLKDDLLYTQEYATCPDSLLVIAFENETIAGIYSGLPMNAPVSYLEEWTQQLKEASIDLDGFFYSGELIIKPTFKKKGLGTQLMNRLLSEAEAIGYKHFMGVTSIRSPEHPLRPENYFDTDTIWGRFGFKKYPVVLKASWPTQQPDGSVKVEENHLACWLNKRES